MCKTVPEKPVSQFDWTDTRKLNYTNPALTDSMIACMKYWVTTSDIDGFRCDVAPEVAGCILAQSHSCFEKRKELIFLSRRR